MTKSVGYQWDGTNTSLGTSTHDAGGQARSTVHQGVTRAVGTHVVQSGEGVHRAVVTQTAESDMVWVPALQTKTLRSVAEASNLPWQPIETQMVSSGDHQQPTPGKQVAANVEPGVSQEMAAAANDQLTTIIETLDSEALVAVTEQAVRQDPEALQAIGGENSPLVQSYVARGEAWAEAAGSNALVMSNFLSEADKLAARRAIVAGSSSEFNRLAAKSIQNHNEMAAFAQEALDEGYEIEDGIVYEDGQPLGELVEIWQQQAFTRDA